MKRFVPLVLVGVIASGHIQFETMQALQDDHGIVVAQFNNLLLSALLVAMILQRRSLRGQSAYIAAALLLVNVVSWISYKSGACLALAEYPPHDSLMAALFGYVVFLNAAYLALVIHYGRKTKANLLFRL